MLLKLAVKKKKESKFILESQSHSYQTISEAGKKKEKNIASIVAKKHKGNTELMPMFFLTCQHILFEPLILYSAVNALTSVSLSRQRLHKTCSFKICQKKKKG